MFTNLTALGFIVAILVAYYLIRNVGGMPEMDLKVGEDNGNGVSQAVDLGMYDSYNPNAFGTTKEEDRRITNLGVRREYHSNPYPWEEDTCANSGCDKHGVPEPTMGQTHVCRGGFPSKRIVDMLGGHFQLNHVCAPSTGCSNEPEILGRWWGSCGKGCSNPESVGLNLRSICTRCGT